MNENIIINYNVISTSDKVVELEIGKTTVYERINIRPIEINIGDNIIKAWEFDEVCYTSKAYIEKLLSEKE